LLLLLLLLLFQAGEDIIAALCSNSATFEGKTEFAQEKYKRRKARKYTTTLSLRRPTSWGLCEVRCAARCKP
jgi:tRNA (adenine-N(1)-)-methyltransferase non-catalytic subunit